MVLVPPLVIGDAEIDRTIDDANGFVLRRAGKPVAYVAMSQDDYAKALTGFGLPEGFAQVLADSDARAGWRTASRCTPAT